MQLAVGDVLASVRVVALPEDRDLVGARREVPVEAIDRDVELPSSNHLIDTSGQAKLVFLTLVYGLYPVEALAMLAPEGVRIGERGRVHSLITLGVDTGAGDDIGRWLVEAVDIAFP